MLTKKSFSLLSILCVFIAVVLSLTNFYSIGYLLLCLLTAFRINWFKNLPTLFGRFILALLLLFASIMLVGLCAWLLHISLQPFYIVVCYTVLSIFITKNSIPKRIKIIDRRDLYSIILGVLLPLILLASYLMPRYSNAALYQILSNGWDHSSHVFIIETVAKQKGYAYAKENANAYTSTANAYPQAWHLASAHFSNGFGQNIFDPSQPIRVLTSYLVLVLLWYCLSAYLLSRVSLRILDKLRSNVKMPKMLLLFALSSSTLIIQSITLFGAFNLGFANFIGLMTYMLLFAAVVLEPNGHEKPSSHILLASIACSAATLCWFLPFPALFVSLLLYIVHLKQTIPARVFLRYNFTSIVLTGLFVSLCLVQILIFILYSGVAGSEQLNAAGGAYKNSPLFIIVILVGAGTVLKLKASLMLKKLIILVGPLASLLLLIFLYQTVLTNEPSYYYYKLLYLLTLYTGLFFIPLVAIGTYKIYYALKRSIPLTFLAIFTSIGLLVISTQQTLEPLNRIPQKNSRVAYTTAQVMANYLENENPNRTKIIALTFRGNEKPKKNDVYNGDLVSRVSHLPTTCAFYVVNTKASQTYSARIKRLGKCADETSDKIIVITNKPTYDKVKALNKPNIQIVNVK